MANRTISFKLNQRSIEKACLEYEEFRISTLNKINRFRKRLATEICQEAQRRYDSAYGGSVANAYGMVTFNDTNIKVSIEDASKDLLEGVTLVVARGEEVAFIEFGSGVFFNGSVGSSPHPKGTELGMTIGSYGKGNGAKVAWGYYDETGRLRVTRGVPASNALYNATLGVAMASWKIAKEVFG